MKYDTLRTDTLVHLSSTGLSFGHQKVRLLMLRHAGVAELVYAADSKPAPAKVEGSSPSPGTHCFYI